MSYSEGRGRREPVAKKPSTRDKARARAIIAHVETAIARKSGTDITGLTDEELIADLRRQREATANRLAAAMARLKAEKSKP
jgi:hypothetical protein